MSRLSPDMTLRELREWMEPQLLHGLICPSCDRYLKHYRWTMYSAAMSMLARLYEVYLERGDVFVHSRELKFPGQGGDGTRLRYWGLAEQENEVRPDGGKSGYWRITQRGIDFLHNRVSIPALIVFDGEVIAREEDERQFARDCDGKHFNYDEFVRGVSSRAA